MLPSEENTPAFWMLTRRDLALPIGKAFAQGGHAAFATLLSADSLTVATWENLGKPVRVLDCANLDAMAEAHAAARRLGLPSACIMDAGRTVFTEPTQTLVGIGPCRRHELPAGVRRLSLFPMSTAPVRLAQ